MCWGEWKISSSINKEAAEKEAIIDFNDPFIQDFLLVLNKQKLDFPDIYRLRKYLENEDLKTVLSRKQQAYLANNIRVIHNILRKKTACRIFLCLRIPHNRYQLKKQLKLGYNTCTYWLSKFMEIYLTTLSDFGEGNEVLFRRNIKDKDFEFIINLIDTIAEGKLKQMALDKTRESIKEFSI